MTDGSADTQASPDVKALFDLTGCVAIVTGGAGLLGRRHAAVMSKAGAHVVVADLAEAAARDAAEQVSAEAGVEATAVRVDVTRKEEVEAMSRAVVERFGRIDILVNNAALTVKGGSVRASEYFAPFEDYPLELWEQALRVNLTGAFLCCQAVGRQMVRQRAGVILNIASDIGNISPDHRIYRGVVNPHTREPFNSPIGYATTKAALINFTRYLATYWADYGIRVNCLSPGGVYDGHDPQFVTNLTSLIPLGRMAAPDDYAGAVLFLVSKASSYMTGANLIIDGGRTAW